jgi:hypothetical protein
VTSGQNRWEASDCQHWLSTVLELLFCNNQSRVPEARNCTELVVGEELVVLVDKVPHNGHSCCIPRSCVASRASYQAHTDCHYCYRSCHNTSGKESQ